MLAVVLAMAFYPCLSVCQSQVGVLSKGTNVLIWFWHGGFFRPVLLCVLRKFSYLQNKGTSLWNFFLNSGEFRHGISIVERAINLAWEGGRSERDKLDLRRSTN